MTTQLDLLNPTIDDATSRRLGLQRTREVKRPRMLQPVARPGNSPAKSCALVDVPRAAVADPETSHLAAARIKASGALGEQQRHAIDLVTAHPGMTSAELADIAAGRGDGHFARMRSQLGRRLADLKGVHASQGDARICRITQAKCVTWWPL